MSIKVTFVAYTPNFIGGPNIWIQRITKALQAYKIESRVIFFMFKDEPCEIINGLKSKNIKFSTILWQKYTEENVINLLNELKKDPPDVFVPNLSVPAYFATKWTKKAGIPSIGINRSDDFFHNELMDTFLDGIEDYRVDALVCKSEFLTTKYKTRLSIGQRILQCASGTYLPKDVVNKPNSTMKLSYFGRLEQKQKRVFDTIDAVKRVIDKTQGVEFYVYGKDATNGEAISLINSLGGINYKGAVSEQMIQPEMLKHHVFILLSEYEGLSTALIEAMACGLVPVCTKVQSGTVEVVEHNVNGLLVDDRGDSFDEAIWRLKNEEGLWERLSLAARKTVKERYSLDISAKKWAELITDLSKSRFYKSEIIVPRLDDIDLPPIPKTEDGISRECFTLSSFKQKAIRINNKLNTYKKKSFVVLYGAGFGALYHLDIIRYIDADIRYIIEDFKSPYEDELQSKGLHIISVNEFKTKHLNKANSSIVFLITALKGSSCLEITKSINKNFYSLDFSTVVISEI